MINVVKNNYVRPRNIQMRAAPWWVTFSMRRAPY